MLPAGAVKVQFAGEVRVVNGRDVPSPFNCVYSDQCRAEMYGV